jgi:hypothetical protein
MPYGADRHLKLTSTEHLALARCPHCHTANPTLSRRATFAMQPRKPAFLALLGSAWLQWHVYFCETCGGLCGAGISTHATQIQQPQLAVVEWLVPSIPSISSDVPASASRYLTQARETLSSPAASVVMSASAVDAMLKERGYKDGKLYGRINTAERDGVLTAHMAQWAHDIRLDANDERHADTDASGATPEDAARCLEFATTLTDLLFVLPARVKRGLKLSTDSAASGVAVAKSI